MIITSYRFSRAILIVGRSTNTMAPLGQLFGVSLETVLENEASGFLVPLLVKLCIQVVRCWCWPKCPTMRLCQRRKLSPGSLCRRSKSAVLTSSGSTVSVGRRPRRRCCARPLRRTLRPSIWAPRTSLTSTSLQVRLFIAIVVIADINVFTSESSWSW